MRAQTSGSSCLLWKQPYEPSNFFMRKPYCIRAIGFGDALFEDAAFGFVVGEVAQPTGGFDEDVAGILAVALCDFHHGCFLLVAEFYGHSNKLSERKTGVNAHPLDFQHGCSE